MTDEAAPLAYTVTRNLRELRASRGMTQADLAAQMREHGFLWKPNVVAQIETLRRPVKTLELVGLTWVLNATVADLLAGDDSVAMPDGTTIPLNRVRAALTAETSPEETA